MTVVHPINENGPLNGLVQEDLLERDAEFIVMIKAFDESFSQMVYSQSSYKPWEINWGGKFVHNTDLYGNGLMVDIDRIDETEKLDLN